MKTINKLTINKIRRKIIFSDYQIKFWKFIEAIASKKLNRVYSGYGGSAYYVKFNPTHVEHVAPDKFFPEDLLRIAGFPTGKDALIMKDDSGRTIKILDPRIVSVHCSRQIEKPILKLTNLPNDCKVGIDIRGSQVIIGHPVQVYDVTFEKEDKL